MGRKKKNVYVDDDDSFQKDTNDFLASCPKCGSVMEYSPSKMKYRCIFCNGYVIDEDDYWAIYGDDCAIDGMPIVCATCGGPYPQCTISCKLFDD